MVTRDWTRAHLAASAAGAARASSVVFARRTCGSEPTNSPSSRHVSFTNHLGVDAHPRLAGHVDVHTKLGRQLSSTAGRCLGNAYYLGNSCSLLV